jgi:hypothetical protein
VTAAIRGPAGSSTIVEEAVDERITSDTDSSQPMTSTVDVIRRLAGQWEKDLS